MKLLFRNTHVCVLNLLLFGVVGHLAGAELAQGVGTPATAVIHSLTTNDLWLRITTVNGNSVNDITPVDLLRLEKVEDTVSVPAGLAHVTIAYDFWTSEASGKLYKVPIRTKPWERYYLAAVAKGETLYLWIEEAGSGNLVCDRIAIWPWVYVPREE